jgi:transcriptional regulator with XRE-family HTH domain
MGDQEAIVGHADAIFSGPGDRPGREDTATARGLSLGDRLLELRSRRQLTQEALADLTGLSVRTLRYLESGRIRQPRWDTMQRLSDGLELTPAERKVFQAALTGAKPDPLPGPPSAAAPAEQAGADPDAKPGELHRRILRKAEAPTYPTWLPPNAPFFVGREKQLRDLDRLVSLRHPSSGAFTAAVVSGAAGIGKTALAGHWAHRSRDAFPDGQLYINLRGFDPSGPRCRRPMLSGPFWMLWECPCSAFPVA